MVYCSHLCSLGPRHYHCSSSAVVAVARSSIDGAMPGATTRGHASAAGGLLVVVTCAIAAACNKHENSIASGKAIPQPGQMGQCSCCLAPNAAAGQRADSDSWHRGVEAGERAAESQSSVAQSHVLLSSTKYAMGILGTVVHCRGNSIKHPFVWGQIWFSA